MHSTRKESPISESSPSVLKSWALATRPKTWIASLSPVLMGSAMAPVFSWGIFFLTTLFSLLIQIGTNFANDYYDFIKGADTRDRVGPKRAVAAGWISPRGMKKGTMIVFLSAVIVAIPLMIQAGYWSPFVVLVAIVSGILYTAGPKPLAYIGLGEVFVLTFFGPVAMCGAYFLQTGLFQESVLIGSIAPGMLSCSLLIANNLRDEITDRKAKKNTLVVRFGSLFGKIEFAFSLVIPLLIPLFLVFLYQASVNLIGVFFLFPIGFRLIRVSFSNPEELLQGTSLLFFFYTLLYSLSFI